MRGAWLALAVCACGCRAILGIEDGAPAQFETDASSSLDALADTATDGIVADVVDTAVDTAEVVDGAFEGCGIVVGTMIVEALKTTAEFGKPGAMLDGNVETVWGPGDYRTRIRLNFPRPLTIASARIAAYATPAGATESYKFTGWIGGTAIAIGTHTVVVPNNAPPQWLPSMALGPGTYDAITIEIEGGASWVAIGELAFGSTVGTCSS